MLKILNKRYTAYFIGIINIAIGLYMGDTAFGIVASTFGIVSVYLISIGKMENFIWGIISIVLMLLYGLLYQIPIEVFNQCFYLIMSVLGVYIWNKNVRQNHSNHVVSNKFDIRQTGSIIIIFAVAMLAGYAFLVAIDYPYTLFAMSLFCSTIVGQIMLTFHRSEQYIFWTYANVAYLVMYIAGGTFDFTITLMYLIYLFISVWGLYNWTQTLTHKENN